MKGCKSILLASVRNFEYNLVGKVKVIKEMICENGVVLGKIGYQRGNMTELL